MDFGSIFSAAKEVGSKSEISNKIPEGVKKIRPESSLTPKEARSKIDDRLGKNRSTNKQEVKKNSNQLSSEVGKSSVENSKMDMKEIKSALKEYIKDLYNKSANPEAINEKTLKTDNLKIRDKQEVDKLRKEFDTPSFKNKLIDEWEDMNNTQWSRYKEDVYITNKNGDKVLYRKTGQRYDAHHVIPLKLGGNNAAENITPIHAKNHVDIHSKEGSCTKLMDKVKGE